MPPSPAAELGDHLCHGPGDQHVPGRPLAHLLRDGTHQEPFGADHPLVAHDDEARVDLVCRRQDLRGRIAFAQEDVRLHLAGIRGDRVLRHELAGLGMPHEHDRDGLPPTSRPARTPCAPHDRPWRTHPWRSSLARTPADRLLPTTSPRPGARLVVSAAPTGAPPAPARTSCRVRRTRRPIPRRARRRARSTRRPARPRGPRRRPCARPPPPPAPQPRPRSAPRRWHARTRTPRSAARTPPSRAQTPRLPPPARTPSRPSRTRSVCTPSPRPPPGEGRHDTLGSR